MDVQGTPDLRACCPAQSSFFWAVERQSGILTLAGLPFGIVDLDWPTLDFEQPGFYSLFFFSFFWGVSLEKQLRSVFP